MTTLLTFRRIWMGSLGLAFAILPGLAVGQTQSKDYSKGFARFYDLGLPVLTTNAAYVKLDVYMGYRHYDQDFALYELKLAGNAWMLKQDPSEGKGSFITDYCRVEEVYDHKALQAKTIAKMKEERAKNKDRKNRSAEFNPWMMADQETQLAGQWKPADPKK